MWGTVKFRMSLDRQKWLMYWLATIAAIIPPNLIGSFILVADAAGYHIW